MSTDRSKIIDKIKKCLALAGSSNVHEAAAAMRQAQKLMEQYGVTEDDVDALEVESEQIVTPEPWKKSLKLPVYFAKIASLMSVAFGVKALIECAYVNGKPRMAIRYFGTQNRAQIAAYTHVVVWNALQKSWKEYQRSNPWAADRIGGRSGFWVGWIQQVRGNVIAFGGKREEERPAASGAGTELVLTPFGKEMAKIGNAMDKYAPDQKDSKTNSTKLSAVTHAAGKEAAKDFQLHRPMSGAKQRAISHQN